MNSANAFGQSLRYFRTNLKLSQERLSQESGLDRSYISLLERGLRQPSLNTILQISKALNISPVELIKKVEELLSGKSKDE